MKRSVLTLGRTHFFFGDRKNSPFLKECMERAGDYLSRLPS